MDKPVSAAEKRVPTKWILKVSFETERDLDPEQMQLAVDLFADDLTDVYGLTDITGKIEHE